MITPAAVKVVREETKAIALQKLGDHIAIGIKLIEKNVDENLIRAGIAVVDELTLNRLIPIATENMIREYSKTVHALWCTYVKEVFGDIETKYRTAGWATTINLKERIEIIIREKEVDPT